MCVRVAIRKDGRRSGLLLFNFDVQYLQPTGCHGRVVQEVLGLVLSPHAS